MIGILITAALKTLFVKNKNYLTEDFKNYRILLFGLMHTEKNLILSQKTIQIISRFSYQLPQTILGYFAGMLSIMIGVDKIEHQSNGNTLIKRCNSRSQSQKIQVNSKYWFYRAFSLSCFVFYQGDSQNQQQNEAILYIMKNHEFGHTLQSRIVGPLYLLIIALPSLISSTTKYHRNMPWEKWADHLASKYYLRKSKISS